MADFYIFRAILPLQDTMGFSQHKYKMQKFSGFEERTNKKQNRKKFRHFFYTCIFNEGKYFGSWQRRCKSI